MGLQLAGGRHLLGRSDQNEVGHGEQHLQKHDAGASQSPARVLVEAIDDGSLVYRVPLSA